MTHPDPAPPEPKRTPRFNGLVVLLVLGLFLVAGAYVWSRWSAVDSRAAPPADAPVQPAAVPPPDAGSLSPEGAEQARGGPPPTP
ncbi:MAG: hypothetical protein SWI22_11665 [Pseudomonadota bacterium]|nr:hypothetical protein [Pseudomonadota bacterium]